MPQESFLPSERKKKYLVYKIARGTCIFCANMMILAVIFQDLEHLNDFQTISYGGHFVLQNEGKIFLKQNICRSGLSMGCFHILKP